MREGHPLPLALPGRGIPDSLMVLPAEEGLRAMLERALEHLNANSGPFLVMWSQVATNDMVAQSVAGILGEAVERIAGYLDAKVASGELRAIDTAVTAQMIMGSLITYTLRMRRLSPPLPRLGRQQFIDGVVEVLAGSHASPTGGDDEQVRDE